MKTSLDRRARELREAYVLYRQLFNEKVGRGGEYRGGPAWEGGRDKRGKLHAPVWPRLAKQLEEAGIKDSADYTRWIFLSVAASRPVYPNQLAHPRLVAEYLRDGRPREEDAYIEATIRAQWQTFSARLLTLRGVSLQNGAWSNRDIERHVLLDESLELSAFFRYMAARQRGHEDIACLYKTRASRQLLGAPAAYKRAWKRVFGTPPRSATGRKASVKKGSRSRA